MIINFLSLQERNVTCDSAQPWQLGFQDPATPIIEGIVDLHHDVMFFLVIVCIFVLYLLLRVAVLFRQEKNALVERTHGKVIEIVWTITPSIILAIIAVPSLALLYSMDEVIDPALTLKAIGHQWYWSYEYSDYEEGFAFDSYMIPVEDLSEGDLRLLEVDNPIYLPTNAHVRLLVSSSDVLHSWTIPSFGVKVDACPGRLNQTSIFINREGRYYGQCSEICGINHGFMPICVKAVPLDTYISWVSSQLDEKRNQTNAATIISLVLSLFRKTQNANTFVRFVRDCRDDVRHGRHSFNELDSFCNFFNTCIL